MFQRLDRFIRGFFGIASRGSEVGDAESALAARKRLLEEQIAQYNHSLAASVGFCDLLKQQRNKLQQQEDTLQAVLRSQAQADVAPEDAGELALRLHKLRSELSDLSEQLKQAEADCQQIAVARDVAIVKARKELREWKAAGK